MKHLILSLMASAALAVPVFADSETPPPGPPPGGGPGMLTDTERQELHAAHDAALQANPDLAAQDKALHEQMKALRAQINAAMVKADPNVAPILAKIEANRPQGGGPDGPPPPPPGN